MADIAQSDAVTEKKIPTEEEVATEGVRETFESIVVALILAFVFRAFVVEAFVIPTGSMAPSLYGMHANHRCENCNYTFAYGIKEPMVVPSSRAGGTETIKGTLSERGLYVRCPNCTYELGGNADLNDGSRFVMPDAGDRILVLKWPYDIGGNALGPRRWDVCVFKNPQDGEMNYIKRLLGLPGEVLELINGDLYVARAENLPAELLAKLEIPEPQRELTDADWRTITKALRIQRKTRMAQESLWMLHYDHDFPSARKNNVPQGDFNPPHWAPVNESDVDSWDASRPIIKFAPENKDETSWIVLDGRPVVDEYGYNNTSFDLNRGGSAHFNVGDVRLRFVLTPEESNGKVELYLRKGREEFNTVVDFGNATKATLYRLDSKGLPVGTKAVPRELITKSLPSMFAADKAVHVEIENLDYRVALRINGEEILATDDTQYSPDAATIEALRNPRSLEEGVNSSEIRIGAAGCPMALSHVQVHRDVFYRPDDLPGPTGRSSGTPAWGTQGNPIYLHGSENPEYFCCGDNSPQSQDSRLWVQTSQFLKNRPNYQRGTVPADQMIGRAFFVYWPSGLRFSDRTLAIIPNVGRMRFIR